MEKMKISQRSHELVIVSETYVTRISSRIAPESVAKAMSRRSCPPGAL